MNRWLRITLWSVSGFVVLIMIMWLGLAMYIRVHKTELLAKITSQLSGQLQGELNISDMEPSLIRSFPYISVSLNDVILQDSIQYEQLPPLLQAAHIFVKVNTFSLLRRKIHIRQVTLAKATIHLFTDSSGVTNMDLLQGKNETQNKTHTQADISRLQLKEVRMIVENRQKHKFFQLDVESLKSFMERGDSAMIFHIDTRTFIRNLAFNTDKGSFIKDQLLRGEIQLVYNAVKKELQVPRQTIYMGRQSLVLQGKFSFVEPERLFSLTIDLHEIHFRTAAAFLSPSISRKLDSLNLETPVALHADIRGRMKYRDTPRIHVAWKTSGNTFSTRGIQLRHCNFEGYYNNERVPGKGHNDENTELLFYRFQAQYHTILLTADTIRVNNLKQPVLTGRFHSDFPLKALNDVLGGTTFQFRGGKATADLYYSGGLVPTDTSNSQLKGIIRIDSGSMTYLPRNLLLNHCSALLDFTGEDLYLKNIHIQGKKSILQMNGVVRNIARLYFTDPGKIMLDWNIRSPLIDLDEFRSFLGQREAHKRKSSHPGKIDPLARQLDRMLDACNVRIQLQADKINYHRFNASDVTAEVSLTQSGIQLQQISLNHAGGSIWVKGNLSQQPRENFFNIHTRIRNVQVGPLFDAFDNFGVTAFGGKNLRGRISATADLKGGITNDAVLIPQSLYGKVSFDLREGALVHVEALENIGKFIFRRRNLSNITFDELKNTLYIQGDKITIPPMRIASSALNIDIAGVYGMPSGTDIHIDIPLRNPQKDERAEKAGKKKRKKGFVLHLRAVDGDDGKVKIKVGKGKDED